MKQPIVMAHRGASAVAPENTMAAFRKAIELKADSIELDVHMTRDGHIVVAHDEQVNRTSNGKGWIKDMTLEELKELDFGSWFSQDFKGEKIPTLREVLEMLSGWNGILNLEIKKLIVLYEGIEKKVTDLLQEFGMVERTIISSFNHYSLVEVKKLVPRLKTGILYVSALYQPWEYAKSMGADAIHPFFGTVNPEIVEGCRKNGIMVNPYTVDKPDDIKKMIDAGVDSIITNVPDVVLDMISREVGGEHK